MSPSRMDVAAFCMSPLCFRRTRLAISGSPSPIMDVRIVIFSSSGTSSMAVIAKLGKLRVERRRKVTIAQSRLGAHKRHRSLD